MKSMCAKSATALLFFSFFSYFVFLNASVNNVSMQDDEYCPSVIRFAQQDKVDGLNLFLKATKKDVMARELHWGRSAMHFARSACMIEFLKKCGVPVDVIDLEGKTPLMLSASLGTIQEVQLFIAAGANVNFVDCYGCTALHYAAQKNDAQKVKMLLEAGADHTIVNKYGQRAIDLAGKDLQIYLSYWVAAHELVDEITAEMVKEIVAEELMADRS